MLWKVVLDSLLQAMSENKDLEPDELREVHHDGVHSSTGLYYLAIVLDSVIQAVADDKHQEPGELHPY